MDRQAILRFHPWKSIIVAIDTFALAIIAYPYHAHNWDTRITGNCLEVGIANHWKWEWSGNKATRNTCPILPCNYHPSHHTIKNTMNHPGTPVLDSCPHAQNPSKEAFSGNNIWENISSWDELGASNPRGRCPFIAKRVWKYLGGGKAVTSLLPPEGMIPPPSTIWGVLRCIETKTASPILTGFCWKGLSFLGGVGRGQLAGWAVNNTAVCSTGIVNLQPANC